MRTFAILMASLGVFTALLYHFSFWVSFGIVYMSSLLVVTVVAFFWRNQRQLVLDEYESE